MSDQNNLLDFGEKREEDVVREMENDLLIGNLSAGESSSDPQLPTQEAAGASEASETTTSAKEERDQAPAPSAPSAEWDIVQDSSNSISSNEKPLVVEDTFSQLDHQAEQKVAQAVDEIASALDDIESSLITDKVIAEADSSSSVSEKRVELARNDEPTKKPDEKESGSRLIAAIKKETKPTKSDCIICPYYMLVIDYVNSIEVPLKVKDMLLWKEPKCTGAVFGSAFVLLISLASFSLFTVIGSLMLLALSAVGAYRFYLALIFRIKGTPDETFEKLSSYDISLPKDKVKELAHLLEKDVNKAIKKAKSIVLWDNLKSSGIAYGAFYVIYCIGSIFNTLTLLLLALVSAFTLPKVYQIYKKPIDGLIEKGTTACHQGVKQIKTKLPFLNKKKIQ